MSDDKDPAYPGARTGAQEVYVVYRNTVDLEKATGTSFKASGVRGLGITGGFDFNSKADAGYNSKKRMLVLGPTLMLDVPGYLNVSLLGLWESNSPYNAYDKVGTGRHNHEAHPMIGLNWGIPFTAGVPLSFEGYANFVASKGKNEFGGDTKPETHIYATLMYDVSAPLGAAQNTFKLGAGYEYWKNKFGNDYTGAAGKGAFAKTPFVKAEYHF